MRVWNPRFRRRAAPKSSILKQTFPPPVQERIQSRQMRTVFAPSRHVRAPSTRWKTFPPPVEENVIRRMMRVVFAPRKRTPGRGQMLKQTFPPPVEERIQSRLMRISVAARRRWQAPSKKTQVLAPPPAAPSENYFTRVMRAVFAPSRHVPAPSTRWKTFPPPVEENVIRRMMRVVFAPRKRSPGHGQVLKQTFPPPVEENVIRRMMRTIFAPRRRWQAPSEKVQVLAPPPPPPPGGLIPFLRSFRLQGRDRKRSGRLRSSKFFHLFSPPIVPVSQRLKRIAGWFRNFWRVG